MKCINCRADISEDSRFCSRCGSPISPSDAQDFSQTRTFIKPMGELIPGTILSGKYKILEVLGRGGMGVVYKAEDTRLKRTVAMKFLPREMTQDMEARQRFALEAQAAAALSHPNICTIHEIDEDAGKSFIAMECVPGQSLKERLQQGPMGVEDALNVAIQLAEGLKEAHKEDIVHRDIKSANIMISDDGRAKIMDFGLAKVKGSGLLTKEGTTLGTVAYMSPEQAQGGDVDHRSDIWSLGVVLYEMLSGRLPFGGDRETSILYAIVHEELQSLKGANGPIPSEFQRIIARALKKKPESRYSSSAEMLKDLKDYRDHLRSEEMSGFNLKALIRFFRRPQIAVPTAGLLILLAAFSFWLVNRQAKIQWAKQEALPEIARLIEISWRDYTEAYGLAEQAEKHIPKNPQLQKYIDQCSLRIDITTEPSGADVYYKEYRTPDSEWIPLGVSPLEDVRLPVGIFRWKVEKEGYETVVQASSTWAIGIGTDNNQLLNPNDLNFVLGQKGSVPDGMMRVPGASTPQGDFGEFYIDKYEVTNRQYKEFVDAGGYKNREYWKHPFEKDGEIQTWEEAMAKFVDLTERPGPATWQAGSYPAGQENYPVSGISWYEAAAYAAYAGKSLPTGIHWGLARGETTPMIRYPQLGGYAVFAPFSNFNGQGPDPAGLNQGVTPSGAYDMAGNVREWCWNKTAKGRLIRGGAWNDSTYMFKSLSQAPAFDRSSKNGFRCAVYPDPQEIPDIAFASQDMGEMRDFYAEDPVSDDIYQIYQEQYLYDESPLNARVESRDESAQDWIHERVSFDAAYGGERVLGHLFLPQNADPPYQTIVYFPGSASVLQTSSDDIVSYYEFHSFVSFLVKNGRAVLYPVYKGTFERHDPSLVPIHGGDMSFRYAEYQVQLVKDFKRSLDYLETRTDIDAEKFGYFGISWGAEFGALIPAVESRLKASVLLAGGLVGSRRPEADHLNYVTRVRTPTLMLNGKYDNIFIYETSIKPMFDLLGTSEDHKKIILYETDHIPPKNEFIKETLSWLDRYLGLVK